DVARGGKIMAKDVLFEIGLEELPARFVDNAEKQLKEKTKNWLKELRISFESVKSFSTPRRLAVLINQVSEIQESLDIEAKGPAEKIAKDEKGNWTKAAIGFTKGQGKTTDDIYIKEIKGIPYIHVNKHIEGKRSEDLLSSFKEVIESLHFESNMKWGEYSMHFARPIRWLVALYDTKIIPFELTNVKSGNVTYSHRFLGKQINLEKPLQYEEELENNYVIADSEKRKTLITEGIKDLENKHGFHIYDDETLLNEVKNLVEYPTVFTGTFDNKYLDLPTEVLITSMKEHQRYFPVHSSEGKLLPYFISVRNGDNYEIDKVIRGNVKVLHARLADAQFFYEEDHKNSIHFYQDKLDNVIFQEKLGTIYDKVKRVQYLTKEIAMRLSLSEDIVEKANRAAEICKFDLTTNMVNEFTELQGIIGEKYALEFGEDKDVAKAIREHYLPDHADGELPVSLIGSIVSVADKLDTIVGCIYVGLVPTSSQDPYGLRRQAIGVLRVIKDRKWDISVEELFDMPFSLYKNLDVEPSDEEKIRQKLMEFIKHRVRFLLKEKDLEPDVMEAVLKKGIENLPYLMEKASILSSKRNDDEFKVVQEALVRVLNIAKKARDITIDPSLFETESERKLYDVFKKVQNSYDSVNKNKEAEKALEQLKYLAQPIHEFFNSNMVMAEDEDIRENRLGLIYKIASLITNYADLSEIEWKQHF